jgi:hypothetical protein
VEATVGGNSQKSNKHSRLAGAPEEIRTPDPQIRSLVLYPAELRARFSPDITPEPEKPGSIPDRPGNVAKSALATRSARDWQGPQRRSAGQCGVSPVLETVLI